MGRKAKIPFAQKLRIVEDFLSGKRTANEECSELQINPRTFYEWVRKYQLEGEQGLQTPNKNKCYSESIKVQAVEDYNNGLGSLNTICNKYNLSCRKLLQQWIKRYNGHETFNSHNVQGDKAMTKGRKTTYEERTEIVAFCIANNDNYQITLERYQVSYQQVYSWVTKYKECGYEALIDRRGKRKSPEELSENEKVAAKLKLLEAENKRLKMENDFLKKLNEVERRLELAEKVKKLNIK